MNEIKDSDFDLEELQKAKNNLCYGKTPGPDNITLEVIEKCDFDDILLECSNRQYNTRTMVRNKHASSSINRRFKSNFKLQRHEYIFSSCQNY